MRRSVLIVCVLLVGSTFAGVALADEETVRGNPRLSVFAPDNVLTPGGDTTLDLYVTNEGRVHRGGPAAYEARVTTARGTTLDVAAGDAPVDVRAGTYPVGTVPEGTAGPFTVAVRVPADAAPGTYRLPVTLRYRHDRVIRYDDTGEDPQTSVMESRETVRTYVTVRIADRARFRVESASATLPAGAEGRVTLTLRNVGSEPATDAAVTVGSPDPGLRIGAGGASSLAGTWEPNATRRVTVPATATNPTDARSYPVEAVVTYRDPTGIERRSDALRSSVPVVRDRFRVAVEGPLRVGERGDVRGVVTYEGTTTVRDATLTVRTAAGDVVPVDAERPLGTLEPGDSVPFVVPVDVGPNASAGPKAFSFAVDYETATGGRTTSEPLRATVSVDPRADALAVSAPEAAFVVDSENRLRVRVRNVGDGTLRNVRAELVVADPLESDAATGFVPVLGPNESTTLGFGLTVTDEAVPSTYPAELRFSYENERGDRVVAEPAFVAVSVTDPPGSNAPVVAGVVALVVVVAAGVWWWRRR